MRCLRHASPSAPTIVRPSCGKNRGGRVRNVRRQIAPKTSDCCGFCVRASSFWKHCAAERPQQTSVRSQSQSKLPGSNGPCHGPDATKDQEKSTYVETPHGSVAVLRRDRRTFLRPCATHAAATGQMGDAG